MRETREKQLVLWKQLILEYHRTHDLPIFQPFSSALFENVKISRTCCCAALLGLGLVPDPTGTGNMAQEGRLAVAEYLIRCGNGIWEDDTRTRCRIMWKKPAEWAAEIYDFVRHVYGNAVAVCCNKRIVWCVAAGGGTSHDRQRVHGLRALRWRGNAGLQYVCLPERSLLPRAHGLLSW